MSWTDKVMRLKAAVSKGSTTPVRADTGLCLHGDPDCIRCASADFNGEPPASRWCELDARDLRRCVVSLPTKVQEALRRYPGKIIVAGGYIRAIVGNEVIHDLDLFTSSKKQALDIAETVNFKDLSLKTEEKDKHLQLMSLEDGEAKEAQIIWRYPFKEPVEVIEQFDYTVVKTCIWYDGTKFVSACHERFYMDLARKLLVYDCIRDVERIESFPRILKYAHYGYSIDPKSLAEVIGKSLVSLDLDNGIEGLINQLEACYVAGGTEQQWKEISKPYVAPKPKPARSHDYSYGS